MTTPDYRLYPTLLNHFERYKNGYLTDQELLDRINRVPIPQTIAQAKGASFEEAVIKGLHEDEFDYRILSGVRAMLPRPMVKTQVYCEHQVDNVLVYGYVDVIGKLMAVDIKTTSNYRPGCFAKSFQNFYLPALRGRGIRLLRYAITDFQEVYQEDYDLTTDLSYQIDQTKLFCTFLEENRPHITDLRVFGVK